MTENPRFTLYRQSLAPGEAPTTHGYIIWINKKWRWWRRINDIAPDAPISDAQQRAFDAWIAKMVK